MKKKLNVRNLIGAFVGGVVGILTCYYVSLTFMPLGCLIGVVLGFWHDKLIADYDRNLTLVKRLLSACYNRLVDWKHRIVSYVKMPALHLRRLGSIIPKDWGLGRYLVRGFVWFVSLPLLFIAWLRKHPMNRANTITVLTIPIIILALWKFGYFSLMFGKESVTEKTASVWMQFAGIGIYLSTLFVVFGPVLLLTMRSEADMAGFYRQYSRYNRYGAIGWLIYEMKNAVMLFAYAFIFAELMLVGICGIIAMIFLTIAIIMTIVIPARVFWICVQLPGHWFCFGVTAVTTLVTWLIMRSQVVNPAMAWTLALVNGIAAAVVTEVLRHTYEWLVSKWGWLYEITRLNISDGPDATLNFLGRTLCKPVIRAIVCVWHTVQPRLPRIRINPDSFWLPV